MRILFSHQNFPGQWVHLARHYDAGGHEVVALTDAQNRKPEIVRTVRYAFDPARAAGGHPLAQHFGLRVARGEAAALAALDLKRQGFEPDLIAGHGGWGESLFLREVWPKARQILYAEFYYRTSGADVDFDPEFPASDVPSRFATRARNAVMLEALADADRGLAPTRWQQQGFPEWLWDRIEVAHDGVDTDVIRPNRSAFVRMEGRDVTLRPGDEVVTFVNRNLEPYRGYHVFVRSLPKILARRPNARIIVVGGDKVSYGRAAPPGTTWRKIFLDQVKGQVDLSRVHFVGQIPYDTYLRMLQVSAAHVYLTYPFVLSWSMIEAMAAECLVVGSRTPPVEEVIEHGRNGLLVDFFDVDGLADAVVDALARPHAFRAMRTAARLTALERYDLRRVCLPRLTALFDRMGRG
jgi:glycosyltransferase involved in cell wall biosynthesis